jgi:hypothetical protein
MAGSGVIIICFTQEPGVFSATRNESKYELVAKWDMALRLMSLVHILVLQNRLLRGETLDGKVAPGRTRIFDMSEGWRTSPIVCSWDAEITDVQCSPANEGSPDQFELVLKEEAAAELVAALAETIALNGTKTARTHQST